MPVFLYKTHVALNHFKHVHCNKSTYCIQNTERESEGNLPRTASEPHFTYLRQFLFPEGFRTSLSYSSVYTTLLHKYDFISGLCQLYSYYIGLGSVALHGPSAARG